MPRNSNIKWRDSDEQELKRIVKNFNNKISRILKKDPSLAEIIPKRVNIKEFKGQITTRQDFNRELNSLKRFLNRGAEKIVESKSGIKTTAWEKREIGIQVATINRRRSVKRKMLEELEATSRGEALNMTRKQMNSIRMNELNPKTFNFDKITKYDWKKYKASVRRQSRPNFQEEADLLLRENYIKGLKEVFGDTSDTEKLIDTILNMPIQKFINQFYKEQEATIEFIYDPIEQGRKMSVLIEDVWNEDDLPEKTKKVMKKSKKKKAKKKTTKKKTTNKKR